MRVAEHRIRSSNCGVAIQFIAAFLVLACEVSKANTERLCPTAAEQSMDDGEWKIPEEAFTEQAARRELRKLNRLLGANGLTTDSVAWETSFIVIEGWYLRRQALLAKRQGEPGVLVSDFCDFLKRKAFVRH